MTSEYPENVPEGTEEQFSNDLRKELIDYSKWIVNLASFFLTASLGYASFFRETLSLFFLLVVGWILLGVCIVINWLIVKKLVSIGVIDDRIREEPNRTEISSFMMSRLGTYGKVQNLCFVLGFLSIGISMIWSAISS